MSTTAQKIRADLSAAAKVKGQRLIELNPKLKDLMQRLDLKIDFESEYITTEQLNRRNNE